MCISFIFKNGVPFYTRLLKKFGVLRYTFCVKIVFERPCVFTCSCVILYLSMITIPPIILHMIFLQTLRETVVWIANEEALSKVTGQCQTKYLFTKHNLFILSPIIILNSTCVYHSITMCRVYDQGQYVQVEGQGHWPRPSGNVKYIDD